MYTLEKIKINIVKKINKALESDIVEASDLVYPPNSEMGDLSLPLFKIAKKMGKKPAEVASELMSKLSSEEFSSVNTAGSYLNFKLKTGLLAKNVLKEIEKQANKYGEAKPKKSEKIMIEFSNVNTHKEYHIGHLRNITYGDSVVRILNMCGQKATPVSYINDFGIHVAKTLWAYLEFYKDLKLPENKGEFLGEVYVKASNESKENKLAKGMIETMMKKIELREGEEYKLWQKTREWSIEQFDKIYDELDVKFEKKYYESEFIDKGRKQVDGLLKKNILVKSQGAVIADLEKYNLGVLVVLRSDGTATYPVADIPLAEAKFKDYKLDKSIYVVDNAQSLYFKQLFKILELMGYTEEKIHLSYDVVKLPGGKMSSRLGNTVTYAELKQKLFDKALEETSKRHEDWDKQKQEENAWEIAKGAMKFEMIKIGSDQIITFNIDKALSFQGYTSAYLQYTYARINSIIKKSEININKLKINFNKLTKEKEHNLILKLAKFPEVVKYAGKKYDPSEITKYISELARDFNDYYHSIPVLKAEEEIKKARLNLLVAVKAIIKNGLDLLGINTLEEM